MQLRVAARRRLVQGRVVGVAAGETRVGAQDQGACSRGKKKSYSRAHPCDSSSTRTAGFSLPPFAAAMLDSKQLGDMPPLTHVYIMENVSTDLALDELEDRVMKETWFVKEGFDRRSGLGFTAGSLLGVTTALAMVADKWGTEVGESDSVAKATMSNVFLRHLTPPETREIYTERRTVRASFTPCIPCLSSRGPRRHRPRLAPPHTQVGRCVVPSAV